MYTQVEVGGRKKTIIILKERNRMKSNRRAESSVYAHFMGHCLPPWPWAIMPVHQTPKSWCFESMHGITETNNLIMRYWKSLNPSPTVAKTCQLHSPMVPAILPRWTCSISYTAW